MKLTDMGISWNLRIVLLYHTTSTIYVCWLAEILFLPLKARTTCLKLRNCNSIKIPGTSPVAQWLRICLPMQGTRVWSLVREDPTCRRATKPMCHNYWACTLEPTCHNYWARVPQRLKPPHPRARAPQREATATRSPRTTMKSSPHSPQLEKAHAATKTQHSQK